MGRPGKPWWWAARKRWAATVDGVRRTAPPEIGRKDEHAAWAWHAGLGEDDAKVATDVVKAACELYLQWDEGRIAAGGRDRRAHESACSVVQKICDTPVPGGRFGDLLLADVERDHLDALLAAWAREGVSPGYRRALAATTLTVFRWAARRVEGRAELIPASPFTGAKLPPVPRAQDRYASRDEAAAWLRWLWRKGYRDLAQLQRALIHTGARPSELTRATWGEVVWNGARPAVLTRKEWKSARKTGKARRVYLPLRLHRMLRRRRASGSPILFATRTGIAWSSSNLSVATRKLRAKAIKDGVPLRDDGPDRLTCYRWRHTAISSLLTNFVPVSVVAELMGTSPQMISTTYTHILSGHLSEAAERLARKPATGSEKPPGRD